MTDVDIARRMLENAERLETMARERVREAEAQLRHASQRVVKMRERLAGEMALERAS